MATPHLTPTDSHRRLDWLSVLRGLNIVLVVMFHVQLIDMATGQNHALCEQLPAVFTPIRMPFFIFTSGGLLYLSRINKQWSVGRLYWDKFQRIVIPFIFFVTFYYAFKLAFSAVAKTPPPLSAHYFLESFYCFPGHPSAHLWFLAVLMVMMALYPLFRWLCGHTYMMTAFLLLSAAIYPMDLSGYLPDVFYIAYLNKYLIYFFAGIYFFRYRLYQYISSYVAFALSACLYVCLLLTGGGLPTSLTGIVMAVSAGILMARHRPRLFSSFRDYIYQIYLLSLVFQAFVELVLWKRLFYNEHLFLLFYILNILAGIYGPTLIARMVQKCPYKVVRLCMGLK